MRFLILPNHAGKGKMSVEGQPFDIVNGVATVPSNSALSQTLIKQGFQLLEAEALVIPPSDPGEKARDGAVLKK